MPIKSLALIGRDISHSKSPEIYRELIQQDIDYKIYDCAKEKDIPPLNEIFEKHQGLSVTSPYKKVFLKVVKVLPGFESLNAINAIRMRNHGFEGINTDFLAVDEILKGFKVKSLILLGDGVMSFITQKVCKKNGIKYQVFSRKKDGPIENLDLSKVVLSNNGKVLVINTCSRKFIFRGNLPSGTIFWDYNYDFSPHREYFLTKSVEYVDGFNLLKLQAKFSLEFFRF